MAAASQTHLPPPRPDHSWTRPPKSKLATFFWRQKMWFDATFVFTFLEPWEYFLLCTSPSVSHKEKATPLTAPIPFPLPITVSIFIITASLLIVGIVKYLPSHLAIMQTRTAYYLWGKEGEGRSLWEWFNTSVASAAAGPGLLKEL